jgi:hypothetical protein
LGSFLISVVVIFLLRIIEDVIIEGESFDAFLQNETLANYLITIIINPLGEIKLIDF